MNKIVEYMFFGLPIVCYDLKEARVSAQSAALYVAANNEDAMARGIAGPLDDDAARMRMREIGMARVRSTLAWDYSVPLLLAAYDKASAIAEARSRAKPRPGVDARMPGE
ncbi:MAG: hypothetical protein HY255_09120 [Betaproteobacteria bacterium]|nr:hypothetical protein [Betaproteobacteria bacterium]